MAEIWDLSTTDSSNTGRFPENMLPGAVNDGMRALEGMIARWRNDLTAYTATAGAANAYTLSLNQSGIAAYATGLYVTFAANHTNTGAATLNVNGLGAKAIHRGGAALAGGEIVSGERYAAIYDGTQFDLIEPHVMAAPSGTQAAPPYTFAGDTDTGMWRNAANEIQWTTGGTSRLVLSTTTLSCTIAGHFQGNLTAGSTSNPLSARLYANSTNGIAISGELGGTTGSVIAARTANTGQNLCLWQHGSTTVGFVNSDGTTTTYGTTSDGRLKRNRADLEGAGEVIDAIEVKTWDWSHVEGAKGVGVIAQDVAQVWPEAVSAGDSAKDYDPDKGQLWGVDYSKFVPLLLAEVKALRARVKALESA